VVGPDHLVKGSEKMRGRIEDLSAELRAISVWDRLYSRQRIHDAIERAALQARRERRAEIQRELQELKKALCSSITNGLTRKTSSVARIRRQDLGDPA